MDIIYFIGGSEIKKFPKILLNCFILALLLTMPHLSALEYTSVKQELSAKVSSLDYFSYKIQELQVEPLFIILLLILSLVDIPLIIISLILSIIEFLIYIPVLIVTLIYEKFFWEDTPGIPDWPPSLFVVLFFAILLMFTGIPTIFLIASGLYFINFGYEDFSDYFKDAAMIYEDFITNLLMPDFG